MSIPIVSRCPVSHPCYYVFSFFTICSTWIMNQKTVICLSFILKVSLHKMFIYKCPKYLYKIHLGFLEINSQSILSLNKF
jgi:hypothetical protein